MWETSIFCLSQVPNQTAHNPNKCYYQNRDGDPYVCGTTLNPLTTPVSAARVLFFDKAPYFVVLLLSEFPRKSNFLFWHIFFFFV